MKKMASISLKGHREHDHVMTVFHLKVNSNYMLFFTKACVRLCNNLRLIRRKSVNLLGDLNYFHLCFNRISWRKDKQHCIIQFGLIMCSGFPWVFFSEIPSYITLHLCYWTLPLFCTVKYVASSCLLKCGT